MLFYTDEGNKLVVLRLLKGYLQLLGSHVSQLTFSYAHMTRLIQALVQVSTIYNVNNCSDVITIIN